MKSRCFRRILFNTFYLLRYSFRPTNGNQIGYQNPEILDELIAKYAQVARKHVEAWSNTGIKMFVSYGDIALGAYFSSRVVQKARTTRV